MMIPFISTISKEVSGVTPLVSPLVSAETSGVTPLKSTTSKEQVG
jgi:hypothetical protein